MINELAEGRAYHALKYLFDHWEAYQYPFYTDLDVNGAVNAFRFQQDKLSEDNVQFYPSQLVMLARYYRCHYPRQKGGCGMTPAETRQAMLHWIASLYAALRRSTAKPITGRSVMRLTATDHSVPLFDNLFPLDCILAEAEQSGALDSGAAWPDPAGLPLAGALGQRYPGGDPATFWRAQLASLARTEWYARGFKTVPTADDLIEMAGYRRVEAVLLMAVRYARALAAANACARSLFPDTADDTQRIRFENGRTARAVMALSTPASMKACLSAYHRHFVRQYAEGGSGITFLFTDPARVDVPDRLTLPALDRIDQGVRIRETALRFYGLKPETIAAFFQDAFRRAGAAPLLVETRTERTAGGKQRSDHSEVRYTFGDAAPERLREQIGPAVMHRVETTVRAYRKTMGRLRTELAAASGDIVTTVRRGEVPTDAQIQGACGVFREWTNGYAVMGRKCAEAAVSPRSAAAKLPELLLMAWRFRCNDGARVLVDGLSDGMQAALMLADDPVAAMAALAVRARTMLYLMLDDWAADGAPPTPQTFWYAAAHLAFSRSRLDQERERIRRLTQI